MFCIGFVLIGNDRIDTIVSTAQLNHNQDAIVASYRAKSTLSGSSWAGNPAEGDLNLPAQHPSLPGTVPTIPAEYPSLSPR